MDLDMATVITLAVIAAVVVLALAWRFDFLNIRVKKGDAELSIEGKRSQEPSSDPASGSAASAPHIGTQNVVTGNPTNAARDQLNAGRDITQAGRDVVHGDNVAGDKSVHEAGRDITHVEGDLHVHQAPENLAPSNLSQITEPVADFVGREKEINDLLAAFDGAGQGAVIVGAKGMGGVGKTELAKKLAKGLKDRFPDGQIYFNLRGASDDESRGPASAAEALSHVIRSFHPDTPLPEDVGALRGLCHGVLEGKRVLLLMDNALDAAQLGPMTPPPDGCALMVTSRQHFILAGMEAIDLDTLPPEKSRELLLEICSRIGEEGDALAERCGHLPLALRLAASALETRPALRVATYISDLGLEPGVEASLAMSYRLLDESIQEFWRALSVFPGDFDHEAAGAVGPLPDGQDAETALGDLHAASMVQWEEATGRYRLHDLARDYARGRLGEDERGGIELRHAAHYLAVLAKADDLFLEGDDSILLGLTLFDREWGNIDTGQKWAADRRGTDKAAAKLCSDYPNAGAYCLNLRLHSRDQIVWLEAAVEAARTLKDRHAEGNHLGNLGNAYSDLGETRKAIEFFEQQLLIVREIGGRRGEESALGNLGNAYAALGETPKAIEFFEQALVISREIGDRHGEENALGNLGIAYAALGETPKAIEFNEQALVISREIGDRHGEGNAMGSQGNAYAVLGEMRKAIEFYEQQLLIVREIGDRRAEGRALGNLGNAYADLGEPRKAIEYHDQALVISQEIGNRRGEGIASYNLADALSKVGRGDEAVAYAEKAVEIFEAIESPGVDDARALLEELRLRSG